MNTETVSIIIPAWNEESTLKATISSLHKVDYEKQQCEVLVVAGGRDRTFAVAQEAMKDGGGFSRYVLLEQKPEGKNAAIQEGIKEARGRVIVLVDADTIVSPKSLVAMIRPIIEGESDLTIANPDPIRKTWISDYYTVNKLYFLDEISTYSGNAMAFEGSVVRGQLDFFFDKSVQVGVDYLLAKRFRQKGLSVSFVKDAVVKTHSPSTLKYFVITEWRWASGLISIEGVNYGNLLRNFIMSASLICLFPFSMQFFLLVAIFHGVYAAKKVLMFREVSNRYNIQFQSEAGFVFLSYLFHLIGLFSYLRHFMGFSRRTGLCQGERS